MKVSVIKIVLLALTLILIPATAVAKEPHNDNGYRGEKEHHKGKWQDDDDDDHRGKKSRKERQDDDDDDNEGHHNNRGERARRMLSKLRLEESVCKDVEGKWPRGLCYAYCEALDCDGNDPRGSANSCTKLGEKYLRMTDTMPPCVNEVTLSCPCFGDLETVFNGSTPSCSPIQNPTLIWDSSSGTQVQAVATTGFNACIGVNGLMQTISVDDANGCLGMIAGFCPPNGQ